MTVSTNPVYEKRRQLLDAIYAMHDRGHIRIDAGLADAVDHAWREYDAALTEPLQAELARLRERIELLEPAWREADRDRLRYAHETAVLSGQKYDYEDGIRRIRALAAELTAIVARLDPDTEAASEPEADPFSSYNPRAVVPLVGSMWIWEPNKLHARQKVQVTMVTWNGEEWWVTTITDSIETAWNDLSRFWEACVPMPDPNYVPIGGVIRWNGRPDLARPLPSGWVPCLAHTKWSQEGEHSWKRIG